MIKKFSERNNVVNEAKMPTVSKEPIFENKVISEEDAAKQAILDSLKELQDEFSGHVDDVLAYLESTIEDYEEYLSKETYNHIDDLFTHISEAQVSLVKAIISLRK